jgi:hypothetical protein
MANQGRGCEHDDGRAKTEPIDSQLAKDLPV